MTRCLWQYESSNLCIVCFSPVISQNQLVVLVLMFSIDRAVVSQLLTSFSKNSLKIQLSETESKSPKSTQRGEWRTVFLPNSVFHDLSRLTCSLLSFYQELPVGPHHRGRNASQSQAPSLVHPSDEILSFLSLEIPAPNKTTWLHGKVQEAPALLFLCMAIAFVAHWWKNLCLGEGFQEVDETRTPLTDSFVTRVWCASVPAPFLCL